MADATESAPMASADSDALVARAVACRQAGQLAEAAGLFEQAAARAPDNPSLQLFRAETLYRLGRLFSAHDAIAAALPMLPGPFEAEFLAGRILTALGRSAEAVTAFERALRVRPDTPMALHFLAPALYALGRTADAEAAFARADLLEPQSGEFYNQLGIDLLGQRRSLEAEAAFRRAVKLAPRLAPAHQNLGAALAAQEKLDEAIAAEKRAIQLAPSSAAAWNNRAVFEGWGGDFASARRAALRALQLDADHPDALNTLAQIRLEEGDAATAVTLVRRVLEQQPQHRAAGGALLMNENYLPAKTGRSAIAEAKAIAARLRPEGAAFRFERRERDPARRLRIGYVSADFRQHSCAAFIRPLFAAHDRSAVEIFGYSENPRDDDVTATIRSHAREWRSIFGLGDPALAELIQRDQIDILVDLSGHTAGNRLPAFALKPAPVQVTWLGYPNTTGLADIDYRITDAHADPLGGESDALYTERLWRLPGCFLVYEAASAAPPVGERAPGSPVTFGSFNHLPKVTPEVVAAWSQILAAVPGSRLIMKAKRLGDADVRRRYAALFAAHGIASDRLEFVAWQRAPSDHLRLYQQIDIALDPFPYNGTTTTCEALWMGVPVITLSGNCHAARVGASLLQAAGLPQLIAHSTADYVERAISLARASDERTTLRSDLRQMLQHSSLCDGPAFARRLENAFREMWRIWCAKSPERS